MLAGISRKIKTVYKQEGWKGIARRTFFRLIFYYRIRFFLRTFRYIVTYYFLNLFWPKRGIFNFRGENYEFFRHWYNATWRNERSVEVPVILGVMEKNRGKRILEIGNVLQHYVDFPHDILDKYEKGKGVINEDIIDLQPTQKYDLMVSISTLEHVGWDEEPKEPKKILTAVQNLRNCLISGSEALITVPLGYNSNMDKMLFSGELKFNEAYFLKRTGKSEWREISFKEAGGAKYGSPFSGANVVVFGILR